MSIRCRTRLAKEDEPQPIRTGKVWFLDLAVEGNELLAKQGILGDEFGSTPGQVGRRAENNRITSWLGEMAEGLIEKPKKADDELTG